MPLVESGSPARGLELVLLGCFERLIETGEQGGVHVVCVFDTHT